MDELQWWVEESFLWKLFTCKWKLNEEWSENTSICSRGRGIPIVRITFCGRGLLQRDHRNASIMTWSPSFFSPFAECGWWFWDFSVPRSCDWVVGVALTNFSPIKQSSYLQRIESYLKWTKQTNIFQDHYRGFFKFHKLTGGLIKKCIINENNNDNSAILFNMVLHL